MPTSDIVIKASLMALKEVLLYGTCAIILGWSVYISLFTLLEKLGISYPKRVRRACIPYVILLVGLLGTVVAIFS